MSFGRTVLASFIGGVLAIVFMLAWRASKETGKSIPASIVDVPGEAQRLASDVKSRAVSTVEDVKSRAVNTVEDVKSRATTTAEDVKARAAATVEGVKSRTTEAINTGLETFREKEAAVKERIVGHSTTAEGEVGAPAEQS